MQHGNGKQHKKTLVPVLGEDAGAQQLMDAVHGQEPGHRGGERGRDGDPHRVLRHHALREDLLGEDALDDGHAVGAHAHLDAECLAHELGHLGNAV